MSNLTNLEADSLFRMLIGSENIEDFLRYLLYYTVA